MSFERVCKQCGDIKVVTSRKDVRDLCGHCSKVILAKKMSQKNIGKKKKEKVVYWSFCPTCNHIEPKPFKRKSHRCEPCAKSYSRKNEIRYSFDFESMRIIKVSGKIEPIYKDRIKIDAIVNKRKFDKKYSKIGVDGNNKVNIGLHNKKVSTSNKDTDISIRDITKSEQDMINNFLNKNNIVKK